MTTLNRHKKEKDAKTKTKDGKEATVPQSVESRVLRALSLLQSHQIAKLNRYSKKSKNPGIETFIEAVVTIDDLPTLFEATTFL